MSAPKMHFIFDGLYDRVRGDKEDFIHEDEFRVKVDELVDIGYMETSILDDFTLYSAKAGFKWSDFFHIDDPIKKSILLLLVDNPTTFFVLQNTQKGKMRIASNEIKSWGQDSTKKVVAFLVVDNDKTLADQSVDGVLKTFAVQGVKLFTLSSTSKDTFDSIKTYIDAYAAEDVEEGTEPEYHMPLIVLLANPKQIEKMIRLLHHIHKKVTKNKGRESLLRYGIIWDEADKTYSSLRNKDCMIDGASVSCYTYIVEKNEALYRLGFVSATDGDLLEDYPECANAYLYPVEIVPDVLFAADAMSDAASVADGDNVSVVTVDSDAFRMETASPSPAPIRSTRDERMKAKLREGVKTVFVHRLPPHTTIEELHEVFAPYGTIAEIYIPKYKDAAQPNFGTNKTYAFIKFTSADDALLAFRSLFERLVLRGIRVRVTLSKNDQ